MGSGQQAPFVPFFPPGMGSFFLIGTSVSLGQGHLDRLIIMESLLDTLLQIYPSLEVLD